MHCSIHLPTDLHTHTHNDTEFHGCLFWDLTIFLPLTNLWYIGSDVLQLSGNSVYTGCTWLENNIIINENGIGLVSGQAGRGGWRAQTERERETPVE